MSFSLLGLSKPTLDALNELGYQSPFPIQEKAIPAVLTGRDVMAAAQTGTGKTASFALPIIERLKKGDPARGNQVRALILTPTRELASQVQENVEQYTKYHNLRSIAVFGGVKINPQMMKLRKGCDILVATPGRLIDLFQNNAVRFNRVEVLVMDEADRMLDMGFIRDIRKILNYLPKNRQNLLFSATFSKEIRSLAQSFIDNPIEVVIGARNTTAEKIKQLVHPVDKKAKPNLLLELITKQRWHQVLVFTRTKHGANKLTRFLEGYGVRAAAIHGNKSQGARTRALADFKSEKLNVLVATDIAARGLDIHLLPQVVNFDLPSVPEDYVHRIGRTCRAGADGAAVSLVSADEIKQLADIERLIKQKIPREMVDGFVPDHDLPENYRAPKSQTTPKKPAKKRGGQPGQRRGAGRTDARRPQKNGRSKPNPSKGKTAAHKASARA